MTAEGGGMLALGLLVGLALTASLAVALLCVLLLRRLARLPTPRALAVSFAIQAVLVLLLWLGMASRHEGIALLLALIAPVALTHAAIAPFLPKG